MKAITPKIAPSTVDFIPEYFRAVHPGAEYILDAFPPLFKRTLREIRGRFARGELCLMIDTFNATYLQPGIAGQHLLLSCADAMELDGLDEKWKVDRKAFTEKLKALTIFQAACMEVWANGFWYAKAHQVEDRDLEAYVAELAS